MQIYSYHGVMLPEHLNLEINVPYSHCSFLFSLCQVYFFVRLEVDVTGDVTPNAEEDLQPGHLTLTGNMKTLNPWFSSVEGNPIPQVVNEDE